MVNANEFAIRILLNERTCTVNFILIGDLLMVWYGMVWYGMVWYGMVWYGMV